MSDIQEILINNMTNVIGLVKGHIYFIAMKVKIDDAGIFL